MASGKSIEILEIDEEALLRTYRISNLKPTRWQDVNPLETGHGLGPSSSSALRSARTEEDPLGLIRGPILTDAPAELRSLASTNSKNFNPKTFLSTVHPNASFGDLKRAGARLRDSLEQRSEALKILVESESDRFVSVKAALEYVIEEMRSGPLLPESDYFTATFMESLRLATSKADQVYTPILENRKKADRLRSTLGVFERSKFFFNLPGTLIEAIEAERYDTALLAYKRGRNMLDTRPDQALNLPAPKNPEELAQQKRIFDKVWSEVEKVMDEFKAKLLDKLCSSEENPQTVEEIEKSISIISELAPMDDPAWNFCENQHKTVMEKLTRAFNVAAGQTQAVLDRLNSSSLSEEKKMTELRRSVFLIESTNGIDTSLSSIDSWDSEGWSALLSLLQNSSELLSKEINLYWKVVKAYMDGKYKHPDAKLRQDIQARRSVSCKQMIHEIVLCYSALLSQFFNLTSDPNSQSSRSPADALPMIVPRDSTSISAAIYMRKLVDELSDWSQEIFTLELPKESMHSLEELIGNFRSRLLSILSIYWVQDAKIFECLEDWTRPVRGEDEGQPVGTTVYLKRIYDFHRHMTLSSFVLAGGSEQVGNQIFTTFNTTESSPNKKKNSQTLPLERCRMVQSAFIDAIYGFLDGLVNTAFAQSTQTDPVDKLSSSMARVSLSSVIENFTNPRNYLPNGLEDEEESDIRVLLTISNLSHLSKTYIPRLFKQFSEAFSIDMISDRATLMDVIEQLDTLLLGDYIKRKAELLAEIIQVGVLGGEVDWYTAPKPTEVHSFIYDALLNLVLVHAQVTSITGPVPADHLPGESLVRNVLSALVEELSKECLKAFGSVQKFGMGGMLQATLEIEFMHQTLTAYVTPEADQTLQGIYQKISSAYQRAPSKEVGDGNNELQKELEALKRTLHFSRRTTALAFVCFKKPKSQVSPSRERQ
ncbi:exocyst complex component Sec5-domain-containing protein [Phakopsora pachyrhizi]|uniref:Exocyst complex component SEC5 n=1 Tax=Phakopsora pachyrhizi TaxID=170000 RepID=A0AAV0AU35_PHAPC|nr:exocyst complex component Sec5-domain-containing protein [Phakopsora pachyrhizi]CAH7672211.1 exocyst complex component Sec5-domain-containing protein [Phakopsora pachyrhizi]